MDTWRIHQPLWKQDKVSWTDKFIAKNPATASYEERMARYTKNAAEIWRTAGNVDCGFVRIRTQPLAAAVRDEALGWVKALRDGMQALDLQTLQVGLPCLHAPEQRCVWPSAHQSLAWQVPCQPTWTPLKKLHAAVYGASSACLEQPNR